MRSVAHWLNSLVMAAGAAGLTVAAVGVLLVLSGGLEPTSTAPFAWFSDHLAQAQGLGGGEQVLAYALSIVAGLAGVLIALIELRLLVPAGAAVLLISDDELGRTTIERDSVESFLGLVARSLSGVESAIVRARGNRDGTLSVATRLRLNASMDTVVPDTAQQARSAMTEASVSQLGLEIVDLAMTTEMKRKPSGRKRKRPQLV